MNDTRINQAHSLLEAAHTNLNRLAYDMGVITAVLDDARELIVNIVDESRLPYPKAINRLDAARNFINSAIKLVQRGWAASEAQVLIRSAMDQLEYAQQPGDAA